jgi:hypothetical protein
MDDLSDFSSAAINKAVGSSYNPQQSEDDFSSSAIHAAVMNIPKETNKSIQPITAGNLSTQNPIAGIAEAGANAFSSLGTSIIGGYRGTLEVMRGLVNGKSFSDAVNAANDSGVVQGTDQGSQAQAYQPKTIEGQRVTEIANLPGQGVNWLGQKVGNIVQDLGASPGGATLANVGTQALATALTLAFNKKGGNAPVSELPPQYNKAVASATPQAVGLTTPETVPTNIPANAIKVSSTPPEPISIATPELGTKAAMIESPPVAGGLPLDIQAQRAETLQRIGLDTAWKHAITGDAMEGATNAQLARFDEPAGIAAREQFAKEYTALNNHADSIIQGTGGTSSLTEDALHSRGQTIAAPFDAMNKWFDTSTKALYDEAKNRSGGLPNVSTQPIEDLLSDKSFNNSAMAKDKGGLVTAIKSQLDLFKENNPAGLTVANAEDFRKWLNQQWTNDNKYIVGKAVGAVDDAVTQSAGEDVYAQARAQSQLKKQILQNPNGVNRIMDVDPNTPVNRTTPFEKIPDTVTRLSVDQFNNLLGTLKNVPPEIQPLAQAAIGEIKAQMANKLSDAGQPNTKTPSVFWNNRKVNNYIEANQQKIESVFNPEELSKIRDLRAGGNILAVDAAYPGAAAQAANVSKQGLMGRIIPSFTTSVGGAVGSIFGPGGAAGGAWAGRAMGERMATSSAEKSALKTVGKRMISLSEVGK